MEKNIIKAIEFVAIALECEATELDPDSKIYSHPNWDRLAQLSIMMVLEQKFKIEATETTNEKYSLISSIAELFG